MHHSRRSIGCRFIFLISFRRGEQTKAEPKSRFVKQETWVKCCACHLIPRQAAYLSCCRPTLHLGICGVRRRQHKQGLFPFFTPNPKLWLSTFSPPGGERHRVGSRFESKRKAFFFSLPGEKTYFSRMKLNPLKGWQHFEVQYLQPSNTKSRIISQTSNHCKQVCQQETSNSMYWNVFRSVQTWLG